VASLERLDSDISSPADLQGARERCMLMMTLPQSPMIDLQSKVMDPSRLIPVYCT
jgi:hypothetical protein